MTIVKKVKIKKQHFRRPVNRKPNFFTNWIWYWQIRFFSYYAFSLNQMSDIREVWKYWPLKDGFRSISQKFYRAAILWWVDQKFKLLADISFESCLQNIALSSLQLFSCASYWVDLDDIQWNEVATWTVRNFNNSWPLNLNFSNMITFSLYIWFIQNSKCQQFLFWQRSRQKKNNNFFYIFKGPLFSNGCFYWHEFWRVLRYFYTI